jgi:hypothetical protein
MQDTQGTKEAGAMSLAQFHYTSAPPGPDGSGFRFTAVTPGLPQPLLTEAEQLIGYEPPSDAPPAPTTGELASCPTAFSHSVLSDGSRLLARTLPTGADHHGGWGNFHTHAVVLPPDTGLPGGVLPISAWNSPRWAAAAPDGGSPAQLEGLPASGDLGRDVLVGFAASRAPWLAEFLAGVRALSERATPPRIVLVERESAAVARWIALAGAALPADRADRLTFTTYTRRPRLAAQQIIGVLPEDATAEGLAGLGDRYRVHDCTGAPPARAAADDAWAEIAARVWLGRSPELFAAAAQLPGGPLCAGSLAVVALEAGVAVGSGGRTEVATWAQEHARDLDDARLHRIVEALRAPADDRTAAESAALTRLFTALSGKAPAETTTALGTLALTTAVQLPDPGVDLTELRDLPQEQLNALAAELAPELRAGIAADAGADPGRPVELLRVAGVLGVDCADLLPGLADRLSRALLADPDSAYTPALHTMLDEHFELRIALLGRLDTLAAADPPAAARLLGRTDLAFTGVQILPHLRMCAGTPWLPVPGGDRVTALHAALRACGISQHTDPLVLRTAVRLVWDGAAPSAGEARQMLDETGSDAHRTAGTWRALVDAALGAPADDVDAPDLAHDLLRCFPEELETRVRAALVLLDFVRDLRSGRAASPWTDRTLALRADAEPLEPALLTTTFNALAHRLLSMDRPDGELYALIHSGDRDLLAAYTEMSRSERVRERLGSSPTYVADCFIAWSSLPGANTAWDTARSTLLDKVLRPAVRALPAAEVASVEQSLEAAGAHRAEEFRAWSRPGTLSRLGRRLGGSLGRRGGR